ncbi:MAG TPA: hypothetical protein VEY09_09910 [Pyrinomonadaceae bacterium]|nr:hypothetical protein [Pyrinomonadaceae bacterium]
MRDREETEPGAAGAANPQQPDADATSSETLEDVEAGEKVSTGSGVGSESSPLETSSPEPETGGGSRADGSDSGGPM